MNYLLQSGPITWIVLFVLSFYFILTFWIFFDRFHVLRRRIANETESLRSLYSLQQNTVSTTSLLHSYIMRFDKPNKYIMDAAVSDVIRISTKGLTWLSVFASTSPFIGLFGTVVGILKTFANLGDTNSASLGIVAPAISEALVATAAGIVVAVFAYSFHLILKRKAYELSSLLKSQSEIVLSRYKD